MGDFMKITDIGKSLYKFFRTSVKHSGKNLKEVHPQEMFCNQIWAKALEERVVRQSTRESVSLHGYLNGINHHFIHSPKPEAMDEFFSFTKQTPRDMIAQTDIEFKCLKPTSESMRVIRCIGEKPDFFTEYPLYLKRTQVKKGEIIDMKEYAYATPDVSYARVYLTNNRGILYDIEIPPGARVSRRGDEIVFPRSSRFECTGVKEVKDTENDYKHVNLRYILPTDYWRQG